MDSEQKRIINSLILELRVLMEEELEIVLKHYGIFLNRKWLDIEQLDYLSDEEKQIKKKLEIFIKRKEKIGLNIEESSKEFITEATYHWLNRIFGLKCLESRHLIEEIITTRSDYSDRSYIHRNYLEDHPELKKSEDEGYFQCFYEFLSKLTTEIQIIFDPKDIHMLIKPRITILREIIKIINNLDIEIYQNDEFLGWIYQYFHDKEREIIYKRIKDEKLKIGGSNLIPLTQLYTEDYMVKFLAQNSLGSIWMEMYPKSQLYKNWEYYVESPNKETRKVKDLSEIKILDPACGSGHFLVYIFEILYEMYIEEGKVPVKDIPIRIIENNLYGIDIDTRAIQIAALILYIKYKEKVIDETVEIPHFNLFSSDIISYKTEVLNEFLIEFENNKFLKKIIVTIWSNLEDIREIGSLSQIDQVINRLIDEEIEGSRVDILRFTDSRIENWHSFRLEIINKLKDFLQDAIQTFDINKELFAKEEEKGVWLIKAFENKYDVVITNPPYLGSSKLISKLKKLYRQFYPMSYRDLYSMFIERAIHFLKEDGYAAMITMQNFLFIRVFEKFREFLLNKIYFSKLVHFGVNAFLEMGDHVPAILFVMKKQEPYKEKRGIYFNLQNIEERDLKIKNLINPIYQNKVNQDDFRNIKTYPFVHWISENIYKLFKDNPTMEEIAPARQGLVTSDNEKFLRYWWELDKNKISNYETNERRKWFFYARGGIYSKWFGNLDMLVNWENDGGEIRNSKNPRVQNETYYFYRGITYTDLRSYNFNARILPKNCIFSASGSSIFPNDKDRTFFILGYLNSSLSGYILDFLNPTIHTTVGDINRLPFIEPKTFLKSKVSELVENAIDTKKELLSFDLIEWEFKKTAIEFAIEKNKSELNLEKLYKIFIRHKEILILRIILLEAEIEKQIFDLFNISNDDKKHIYADQGQIPGLLPIIQNFEKIPKELNLELREFYSEIKIKVIESGKMDTLGKEIKTLYDKENPSQVLDDLSYISLQLKINPVSVYNIINELELVNEFDFKSEIENFLTKIIIDILTREETGIVLLNNPSSKEIIFKRILNEIDKYFGEDNTDNVIKQINNLFGKSIDEWIEKDFFKNHLSQFKKRPVIWQLSSENKSFQCLIDYHKLSQNLLLILKNKFVEKRLNFLRDESKNLTESLKNELNALKIKELNRSYMKIEDLVEDLKKFSENLEKVIKLNIEFDEDNGVKEQILPFQKNNLLSINKVV